MTPTLIASYATYALAQTANPIVSPSFTPGAGEIVVVKVSTWDTGVSMGTPTGGGQTFAAAQITAPGGFNQWAGVFTATITGSPGSMTVSSTPSASSVHSMIVERWSNAKVAASPATCSPVSGSGTPSSTVTTTADGSVVTWTSGDAQSVDPATRVYLSSATEDGLQDGHSAFAGVSYFAYQSAATAGAQTVGLSAPTGQKWVIAGVELQATSGGVTADDTAPATDTAARSQTFSRSASDAAAASDAASRTWSSTRSTVDTAPASDAAARSLHLARATADTVPASDTATIPHTTPTNAVFEFGAFQRRWRFGGGVPVLWSQSSLSTEYVPVDVKATVHGAPYDPSADVVAFAFMTDSTTKPASGDWHTGSWDTIGLNRWVAQCLVGPGTGGVALSVGTYWIWVKVTDNPEIPIELVGQLVIT